jgi:hypothetical protein
MLVDNKLLLVRNILSLNFLASINCSSSMHQVETTQSQWTQAILQILCTSNWSMKDIGIGRFLIFQQHLVTINAMESIIDIFLTIEASDKVQLIIDMQVKLSFELLDASSDMIIHKYRHCSTQ